MQTSLVFTMVIDQVTSHGRCLSLTMVMDCSLVQTTSPAYTLVIDQLTNLGKILSFTIIIDLLTCADISCVYHGHRSGDKSRKMSIIYDGYGLFTCADNVSSIYLGHRSADKFGQLFIIYDHGYRSADLWRHL